MWYRKIQSDRASKCRSHRLSSLAAWSTGSVCRAGPLRSQVSPPAGAPLAATTMEGALSNAARDAVVQGDTNGNETEEGDFASPLRKTKSSPSTLPDQRRPPCHYENPHEQRLNTCKREKRTRLIRSTGKRTLYNYDQLPQGLAMHANTLRIQNYKPSHGTTSVLRPQSLSRDPKCHFQTNDEDLLDIIGARDVATIVRRGFRALSSPYPANQPRLRRGSLRALNPACRLHRRGYRHRRGSHRAPR